MIQIIQNAIQVQKFCFWSTNNPPIDNFFILLTCLFNIVLYCERKSVLVTRGSYRVLSYTQPIRLGQNQIVIQG